jgi:hypothetical protein
MPETEIPAEPETTDTQVDKRVQLWLQEKAEREMAIEQAAGQLRVKSILMGSEPLANINNRIVRVGDSLPTPTDGISFEVTEITASSVTVVARAPEYGLVIERTLRMHGPR